MQLLIIIRRDDPPDTQLFVPLQDSSLSAVRRWATARARSIPIIAELLEDITDGAREILTSCPHRRSRLLGGLVRGFSVLLQAAKRQINTHARQLYCCLHVLHVKQIQLNYEGKVYLGFLLLLLCWCFDCINLDQHVAELHDTYKQTEKEYSC
jgi:hypothetical protein